ncbi:SDR family oxidoreductase [Sphingobium sp. LB126]|uniref:SDR family NAD(P)-dependent oxidoreductase n=1 Tax=Sphingobium sp. LB126 TaxID=1983755 RepID=UPI0018D4E1B0|nr:SDR family oxidoreductase [Sphingobium sp. LB126]
MTRIAGKIALVLGGASGIGEAISRRFAAEGAQVIVADWDERRGEAVVRAIGAAARFFPMDVSDPAAWPRLDHDIRAREGRLDILANSAGVVRLGSIEDGTFDDLRFIQSVNSDAVFLACKFAIGLMKDTSRAASIVNILSDSAVRPNHHAAAYGASKGAAINLSRVVALHCAEKGYPIRCNAVLPGLIDTPMTRDVFAKVPDPEAAIRDLLARHFPMGRMGTADEVASAALFLASDEASYVTGAGLAVDGGRTAA